MAASASPSLIHLVVPGLLGPMAGLKEADCLPEAPTLETLLARAGCSRLAHDSAPALLFDLFGMEVPEGVDLPTAAVSRLADGGSVDDAYWLHADPVFLKPDGDRLLLFDGAHLGIREQDSQRLATLFNEHFSDEGWCMEATSPRHWHLRLSEVPDLVTQPLNLVVGRNIDLFLPQGGDGRRWHAALNEIQMLFHSSDVNREREAEGLLPINSLWLSGGGSRPQAGNKTLDRVLADDLLLQGLASLNQLDCQPLPSQADCFKHSTGESLVYYHHLLRSVLDADPYRWKQAVEAFQAWVMPLLEEVKRGTIDELRLYPCDDKAYFVGRKAWWRFWRRRQPLDCYLKSANESPILVRQ